MAYELGKKAVNDLEEFATVAYGISSPTKRGKVMFEQTFTSFEAARANLRNLLLTRVGERVMQPEFGTTLHNVLFEPMDDNEFEEKLTNSITNSVGLWLPYITVADIDVQMTNEMKDQNKAIVKVSFTVGNEIETDTITLDIEG